MLQKGILNVGCLCYLEIFDANKARIILIICMCTNFSVIISVKTYLFRGKISCGREMLLLLLRLF